MKGSFCQSILFQNIKKALALGCVSLAILLSFDLIAQDQCKPVGWVTQSGGVTGGGNATPVVVNNYKDLVAAIKSTSVKVVHMSGTIEVPSGGIINFQDQSGKTLIGLPGSKLVSTDKTAANSGNMYMKRCSNIIVRNMTFEGPGAYDVDGRDNFVVDNSTNIWVDHCEFRDGLDGNFDIKNAADLISVTWCKFIYFKKPTAGGSGGSDDHRFTNLIGSGDDATQDRGKLRITFQYCWWAEGCKARMPRVRFGKVHVANSYFNSTASTYCIQAGFESDLLIESNVFENVKNPKDQMDKKFTAITERNNLFTGTTSGTKSGSGTSFTPPYSLTISNASSVKSLVTNTTCGSGATLDSPTQCGCGAVVNKNPTATLSSPANGTSICLGSTITLNATATDTDGTISKVDFYNGNTLLGTDTSIPYTFSFTPSSATNLTLKVIATDYAGGTGSSSSSSITVNALPTANITSPATSFCAGGSVVLTSSGGASYKWFLGATQVGTNATYTAVEAGSYSVEVTNESGCKKMSSLKNITVNPLPTANITSPSNSFCASGSVVLTSSASASYKWFLGTNQVGTNATYTAVEAGAYTVEVTNESGCKKMSSLKNITVNALPTANITSPATSFCVGGSVVLTSSAGASYKWFLANAQVGTNATYTAVEAGAYSVEVTNESGCIKMSAITQLVLVQQITWYLDSDGDGKGDLSESVQSCNKPNGYVSTAGDACPSDPSKILAGNCGCGNTETSCLDCAGTPNGNAFYDNCAVCVGGTTGNKACVATAIVNGTRSNVSVIPQPFDVNTTITLENYGIIQSITIISSSGTIVETKQQLNSESILVGELLAAGLYSVIIQSEKGVYTTKIIKK